MDGDHLREVTWQKKGNGPEHSGQRISLSQSEVLMMPGSWIERFARSNKSLTGKHE